MRKKPRLDIDSDSAMGFSILTDGKSTTLSLSEVSMWGYTSVKNDSDYTYRWYIFLLV